MNRLTFSRVLICLFVLSFVPALAQQRNAGSSMMPGRVVVSGTVPDEATKAAILSRLQQVYGTGLVIDQIGVGGVTAPANWSAYVPKLISQNLKSIHKGQMLVQGTNVSLRGEVASDAVRQAIAGEFAGALNPTYTIRDGLRVAASSQTVLDRVLANRVVEFEAGSALLTETGFAILDDMARAMRTIKPKRIEVIGHTDNVGDPARNLALSRSRAESVKNYLIAKGMAPELIGTSGMGADQPIMSNGTDEGRRRNRRIEFRAGQ